MACDTEEKGIDPNLRFFDLNETIESSLSDNPTRKVDMLVKTNGKEELRTIESYDMEQALNYLQEFNINKVTWYDKYELSKTNDSEIYEAIDENMKVRKMIIKKSNDTISNIEIDYQSNTIISNLNKQIIWNLDSGLSISNQTKTILGKESDLEIAWKWE